MLIEIKFTVRLGPLIISCSKQNGNKNSSGVVVVVSWELFEYERPNSTSAPANGELLFRTAAGRSNFATECRSNVVLFGD